VFFPFTTGRSARRVRRNRKICLTTVDPTREIPGLSWVNLNETGQPRVVHQSSVQDLGVNEAADPGLDHDRNRNGVDDLVDHVRIGHAGHALGADIGRNAFQGHDSHGSGVFGDTGLLDVEGGISEGHQRAADEAGEKTAEKSDSAERRDRLPNISGPRVCRTKR
jgi:hypothetical protein